MIKNNNKKIVLVKAAFTLIEMLVSIGVITLISALFVANYRAGNQRTDLSMVAQSLTADLRRAQNDALALTKYGDALPEGGWGIHIETATSSYILFADRQIAPVSGAAEYDGETEGNINLGARVTQLSPRVVVEDLQLTNGEGFSSSASSVDITFLPPDPQITIKANDISNFTKLTIVLKETEKNTTKTVEANIFGLIEVID